VISILSCLMTGTLTLVDVRRVGLLANLLALLLVTLSTRGSGFRSLLRSLACLRGLGGGLGSSSHGSFAGSGSGFWGHSECQS